MKKINFLVGLAAAMMLLWGTSAGAQTLVDLQTAFDAVKVSGGAISVPATVVDGDYELIADAPVTITLTGILSVEAGTLTIGDKVAITTTVANAVAAMPGGTVILEPGCTITSSATAPLSAAGGTVIVDGGSVSTTNFPGAVAGTTLAGGGGGTLIVNGGVIFTTHGTASAYPRGIVIDHGGTCYVNGGRVYSNVANGRGISVNGTGSGGRLYVTGGSIEATGTGGRAIQVDNYNTAVPQTAFLSVSGSPTIKGTVEAIMLQKTAVAVIQPGTDISTWTGVVGTNANGARLYDCRGVSQGFVITADPVAGTFDSEIEVELALSGGSVTDDIYKYENSNFNAVSGVVTGTRTALASAAVFDAMNYTVNESVPAYRNASTIVYSDPIPISEPTTITAVPVMMDGIVSVPVGDPFIFVYDIITGIITPPAGEASAYIVANTLFLPESGAVQLYNVGGQLVLNAIATGKTIDVSSLNKGIYIVKAGAATFKIAK